MNLIKLSQVVIVLTLFTAISKYGVYKFPFTSYGMIGSFEPYWIAHNLLSFLFILSPLIAAYYFFIRKNKKCFFWLALFAIPAFIFGIVPIPFANYLYTSNIHLNTVFIAIIDLAFIGLCWYLYSANPSFKQDS